MPMIIVIGSVTARPETLDELREASLAHVRRSRTEAGCVSHAVHQDAEDPLRLFFFERWESAEALRTHFRQPGSGAFMAAVRKLAASSERIETFSAETARV